MKCKNFHGKNIIFYRNNEDYSVYKQIINRQSIKKIEKKTNRFQCFWLKNLIIIQFKYILWNLKFAKIFKFWRKIFAYRNLNFYKK